EGAPRPAPLLAAAPLQLPGLVDALGQAVPQVTRALPHGAARRWRCRRPGTLSRPWGRRLPLRQDQRTGPRGKDPTRVPGPRQLAVDGALQLAEAVEVAPARAAVHVEAVDTADKWPAPQFPAGRRHRPPLPR